MDINDVIAYATEGLTEEQAKPVREALLRDNVKGKFAGVRAEAEYNRIATERADLEARIKGGPDKPGLEAFEKWYQTNAQAAIELSQKAAAFKTKFGKDPWDEAGVPAGAPPPASTGKQYTDDDITRLVDSRFQAQFAPNVAGTVKNLVKVMDKHNRAGRKTSFDIDAIEKIMTEKQIPIEAAYDLWDQPEREKSTAEATEQEIERRVKERVQAAGGSTHFPGITSEPGAMSQRSGGTFNKAELRTKIANELANLPN
jgi:hypothetical protein